MENIERMKPSQTYEVMDLWLRTTIHSNSFVEENFWETHYDFVKEKYINGKENFVYIIDGKIVAFTGVTEDNRITGLFVDPEYQNKGIGTALINFLKSEYHSSRTLGMCLCGAGDWNRVCGRCSLYAGIHCCCIAPSE